LAESDDTSSTRSLLVCGGAGFIGSNFVRRALTRNDSTRVLCYDKLTSVASMDNLDAVSGNERFGFVRGDICDASAVEEAVAGFGGVDAIVNFAAETHVDRSIDDPEAFLKTDVLGTHVLLEFARQSSIDRMVQVSTDEVYGSIAVGSADESHRLAPSNPYAASKAAGDLQALAYHHTHELDVRITRGSNTYGPHQYPEKIIPLFVTNALQDRRLPLYGDGSNVRDWLHVDDHCAAIEAVLERGEPGEVYNVGGGFELTNEDLTHRILAELGFGADLVEYVADRPGHDTRYSLDCRKIEAMGWAPEVDFENGLRQTVQWYRDNPAWWEPIKNECAEFASWQERWYKPRLAP
jgi:dTDP-glucose 4,6-dehydratase